MLHVLVIEIKHFFLRKSLSVFNVHAVAKEDITIGLNITFIGQCIDKQSVFFKSDHQSQLMKFTLPFVPTEKSFLQIYYAKVNHYFYFSTQQQLALSLAQYSSKRATCNND